MAEALPNCTICGDTGTVLSAEGTPRPCSGCRLKDFRSWLQRRREAAVAEKDAEKRRILGHG